MLPHHWFHSQDSNYQLLLLNALCLGLQSLAPGMFYGVDNLYSLDARNNAMKLVTHSNDPQYETQRQQLVSDI